MPLQKDVRISQALSNVAIKYVNEADGYAAARACPEVQIEQDEMKYPVFEDAAFVQDASEQLERAPGTPYPTGNWTVSWTTIRSKPYGWKMALDDDVAKSAAAVLRLEKSLTESCTQKVLVGWERRVASLYTTAANWTNSQTLSGTALWSDFDNSDPDKNIVTAMDYIEQYGRKANTFVISNQVWQVLRRHPQFREFVKYRADLAKDGVVRPALFAELYGFTNVIIAKAVYISTKKGQTATRAYIWGKNCWIGHVNPSPSPEDPSAAYTFALEKIKTEMYRDEDITSTWYRVRHNVTEAISAKALGSPIVTCIA